MIDTIPELSIEEAKQKIDAGEVVIIDLRDEEDFEQGSIPGAIHVDKCGFYDFIEEIDKDQAILICCYKGNRSRKMIPRFLDKGFTTLYNLKGGFKAWQENQ